MQYAVLEGRTVEALELPVPRPEALLLLAEAVEACRQLYHLQAFLGWVVLETELANGQVLGIRSATVTRVHRNHSVVLEVEGLQYEKTGCSLYP